MQKKKHCFERRREKHQFIEEQKNFKHSFNKRMALTEDEQYLSNPHRTILDELEEKKEVKNTGGTSEGEKEYFFESVAVPKPHRTILDELGNDKPFRYLKKLVPNCVSGEQSFFCIKTDFIKNHY